jgi:hypothetical protein
VLLADTASEYVLPTTGTASVASVNTGAGVNEGGKNGGKKGGKNGGKKGGKNGGAKKGP